LSLHHSYYYGGSGLIIFIEEALAYIILIIMEVQASLLLVKWLEPDSFLLSLSREGSIAA
jgi:hypothetical protein